MRISQKEFPYTNLASQVHPCRKDILKFRKNPFVEKDYVRGKNLPFVYGLIFTKERLFIVTIHGDSKTRFFQSKTLKFIIYILQIPRIYNQ